jgi:hypothetical protein
MKILMLFIGFKAGLYDGKLVKNVKNLVHSVFKHNDVHGEVYAYISKWLSQMKCQMGNYLMFLI